MKIFCQCQPLPWDKNTFSSCDITNNYFFSYSVIILPSFFVHALEAIHTNLILEKQKSNKLWLAAANEINTVGKHPMTFRASSNNVSIMKFDQLAWKTIKHHVLSLASVSWIWLHLCFGVYDCWLSAQKNFLHHHTHVPSVLWSHQCYDMYYVHGWHVCHSCINSDANSLTLHSWLGRDFRPA